MKGNDDDDDGGMIADAAWDGEAIRAKGLNIC